MKKVCITLVLLIMSFGLIGCFEESTSESIKTSEDRPSDILLNRGNDGIPSLGFYLGHEIAEELEIIENKIELLLLVGHDGLTYLDGYFQAVKDVEFSVVMLINENARHNPDREKLHQHILIDNLDFNTKDYTVKWNLSEKEETYSLEYGMKHELEIDPKIFIGEYGQIILELKANTNLDSIAQIEMYYEMVGETLRFSTVSKPVSPNNPGNWK